MTISNLTDAPVARSLRSRMEDNRVDERLLDIVARLTWYAIVVVPGREFVAQKILRRYGLSTFVPVRREWRRRNKYVREKELQTYVVAPRYVFGGFDACPLWFDLFALPNVSGVVGFLDEPARIPSHAMARLIRKTGGGLNAPQVQKFMRTHHEFSLGQVVEIIGGPFEGRKVPVVELSGARAKVLVELFGTDTPIEVPTDLLQAA